MERKLHLAQVIFSLVILLANFGSQTATPPFWHVRELSRGTNVSSRDRLASMVDRSRRSDDKSESSSDESTCADPGIPADATRVGKSFHVGSQLFFVCKPGFVLRGSEVLTCRYRKENVLYWDADLPQCVGKRLTVSDVCAYYSYQYQRYAWAIYFSGSYAVVANS